MDKNLFSDEEYAELFSDETSVKQRKALLKQASLRVNYLVHMICTMFSYKLDWWDFDNEDRDVEKHGHFDPDVYTKSIKVIGDWKSFNKNNEPAIKALGDYLQDYYNEFEFEYGYIPSGWLKEDITEDLQQHVDTFLKVIYPQQQTTEAAKKAAKDTHLRALRNSIKNKLTSEEYALITFPKHLL
jgi:hypothetical protein